MYRYPSHNRYRRVYTPRPLRGRTTSPDSSSTPAIPNLQPVNQPQSGESLEGTQHDYRRRWSIKKIAFIGGPLLLLTVIAVLIVPTLLAARRAYNHVFVPRMPHYSVVVNDQGTPVIQQETPTVPPTVAVATGAPTEAAAASPVDVVPTPTVELPSWDGTSRVNILLLGSDTRGTGEVARSDTMILVTINPVTKQVSMLSIPRDLLVTIPNYGRDRINAAYAYGSTTNLTGPGLAAATVEYNFGVTIDYFAEVNTNGLARIIDTMGGVTLDVPTPIKDDEYPGSGNNYLRVLFHTGLQHMNGVEAVQYSRTRHDDNDFARGDRQQQLLRALREQGVGLDPLSKAPDLLNQMADTFRTDLSLKQVLSLAKLGSEISANDIHSYNLLDATTVSYSPGEPYYLIPDWPAIHKILDEMMSR
ncbi:MAG: LCP family protein [Nitrolancea sp.]